jgi:hypothetical protein
MFVPWLGSDRAALVVEDPSGVTYTAPPPVPPGQEIGAPDFIGIGAQKSGTSWWFNLLMHHPAIFFPGHMKGDLARGYLTKERHFFERFYYHTFLNEHVAEYHQWFPRPAGAITGEWTPRYLVDFWVAPLAQAAAPEAKLLVMLRDPVQRFASGMAHLRRTRELDPGRAIEHFARGMYSQQLRQWLRHFRRDRMLILQYEACVDDARRWLSSTFEFLGVDPKVSIADKWFEQRVNVTPQPTNVDLNEAQRNALIQGYEEDVMRLSNDFPEIDLRRWPSFCHLANGAENRSC